MTYYVSIKYEVKKKTIPEHLNRCFKKYVKIRKTKLKSIK